MGETSMIMHGRFGPLRADPGVPATSPELFQPPIDAVSISDSVDPKAVHIVESGLVALIDTGADFCCIDKKLADKYPSLVVFRDHQAQHGATGQSDSKIYNLQIIFGGVRLQMYASTAALRSDGMLCDLLLGMEAIRLFDLNINRAEGLVRLIWVG
jgi:predicted aspartyl protease